jgi:transposase
MKLIHLDLPRRQEIERRRHETHDQRIYERLSAVLWVADGRDRFDVAALLGRSVRQVAEWLRIYRNQGLDPLCTLHHQGDPGKLTPAQLERLKQEIQTGRFRNSDRIRQWVEETFHVPYTPSGIKDLLRRLGASYHKVTGFFWKADPDKQRKFVQKYKRHRREVRRKGASQVRRYCVDACHPIWGLELVYCCWLLVGQQFLVGMGDGRKRLNILGAYCPDDQEYLDLRLTRDNINGEQFVNLLRLIRAHHHRDLMDRIEPRLALGFPPTKAGYPEGRPAWDFDMRKALSSPGDFADPGYVIVSHAPNAKSPSVKKASPASRDPAAAWGMTTVSGRIDAGPTQSGRGWCGKGSLGKATAAGGAPPGFGHGLGRPCQPQGREGQPRGAAAPRGGAIPYAIVVQNKDAVGRSGGHREVGKSIPVEIADGCRRGTAGDIAEVGGLEGAVGVAQQHAGPAKTRHGQVGDAVAVEVPHRQPGGADPGGEETGGLEAAVAVAQQHADAGRSAIGGVVRHGEVQKAVAVEVAHGHGEGVPPGGELAGGLEAAVAVAQQDTHAAAGAGDHVPPVGYGEIQDAVAVEVAHGHGEGIPPGGELAGRLEAAVAFAQQHADRVADAVGHGEI